MTDWLRLIGKRPPVDQGRGFVLGLIVGALIYLACWLLLGCAEATAPVDRGCGEPTDTPSTIAYTHCLEPAA